MFGSSKDENHTAIPSSPPPEPQRQQSPVGLAKRLSKKVIPGLPRAGTFKRQQSELRDRLVPTANVDERRTVSVDRRTRGSGRNSSAGITASARLSAPNFSESTQAIDTVIGGSSLSREATREEVPRQEYVEVEKEPSLVETRSISSDKNDEDDKKIQEELESKWILNLSMHFRDKSKREKFFVTYAETPTYWRRVTISLDYRDAPEGSLEEELETTRFQRDKSARIYEAIRESLPDIQFYPTVTNLKLQTENERLHVHVVEDLAEIISYPPVKAIKHLNCRRYREQELIFESHLSGFVYKVRKDGEVFIKKEIPGPDTVDEFLYEINALHQLSGSRSVIQFGGVVLDNNGELVKGLLISFAEKGALIDTLYDGEGKLLWLRRERWARQIIQGLSEIHEAGFVQGDFTLSNIVIDKDDNAKIIDINRRGCPVGWEPPEVAAILDGSQRISMYIGVKSDLYQLGMVLYALATQQDEPENHRPLRLETFPPEIPDYFLDICRRCLSINPRARSQASILLSLFPPVSEHENDTASSVSHPTIVDAFHVDDLQFSDGHNYPTRNVTGYSNLPYLEKPMDYEYAITDTSDDSDYYPRRGRSPAVPFRRGDNLPFEIPLPPSSSGSDATDSPTTSAAEELTPVASKVYLEEKDVVYLNDSIYGTSQEELDEEKEQQAYDFSAEKEDVKPDIQGQSVAHEEIASIPISLHSQLLPETEGKTDANHLDSDYLRNDVPDPVGYIPQCAATNISVDSSKEFHEDKEPIIVSVVDSSEQPEATSGTALTDELHINPETSPEIESRIKPNDEPEIGIVTSFMNEPELNSVILSSDEQDIVPVAMSKNELHEDVPVIMVPETCCHRTLLLESPDLKSDTLREPATEQIRISPLVSEQTMDYTASLEDELPSRTEPEDEPEIVRLHAPAISQYITKDTAQTEQDCSQETVLKSEQAQESIGLEYARDQTPHQHVEDQLISSPPETTETLSTPETHSRPDTAGTRRTSSEHPDLAFIGMHIEHSSIS